MCEPQKMTLCFAYDDERILLGMKKRGFGVGRWNGFGGKVRDDESVESCARREVHEESGLSAEGLEARGVIHFDFAGRDNLSVHLYRITSFTGELCETDEMRPQWFLRGDIPYDDMWIDDRYWLPFFLDGEMIDASFSFNHDGTKIEQYTVDHHK